MKNPYRRALLLAGMEIKSTEELLLKYLTTEFPDFIQAMTDALGTTTARVMGNKNLKSIFQKKVKKRSPEKPDAEIVRMGGKTFKILK